MIVLLVVQVRQRAGTSLHCHSCGTGSCYSLVFAKAIVQLAETRIEPLHIQFDGHGDLFIVKSGTSQSLVVYFVRHGPRSVHSRLPGSLPSSTPPSELHLYATRRAQKYITNVACRNTDPGLKNPASIANQAGRRRNMQREVPFQLEKM